MATEKYGDITPRTAAFAAQNHLEHAAPVEVLARFGDIKEIPKNGTNAIKFRRPTPFAAATTPLTEGVTPAGGSIAYTDVSVTLAQYGDFVEITDVIADTHEDPVLKDITMLTGEQAALTKEMLLWGVLKAGTNKFYGGDATSTITVAVADVMTRALQRNITKGLKAQKAKKVTKMLSASQSYGTSPVDAAYIAFTHTDLEGQIRDMAGFVAVESYGAAMKALPNEIGKVEDVRYVASPELNVNAAAGAGGIDVYTILVVGANAYGHAALRGAGSAPVMVQNPGIPRGGDPLGQRGTVGWKLYDAPVILNQAWMAVVEVAGV
jgi:N4-gp56 family major capsid protein